MSSLLRFILLLAALAVCLGLVITHGFRGVVVIAFVAVIATVPRTRGYHFLERHLVRLTGSRARAVMLIGVVTLTAMIALNIVQFVR
ncbi:MAG: hypothetical protein M3Z66_10990 [Chloroflexota bacterium]|nr:hypothetical protein [Chloroflexota bacterium]